MRERASEMEQVKTEHNTVDFISPLAQPDQTLNPKP